MRNYFEGVVEDNGTCDVPDADCEVCLDGASSVVDENDNGIADCEDVYGCDNPEVQLQRGGHRERWDADAQVRLSGVCGWCVCRRRYGRRRHLDSKEILGCPLEEAENFDPWATDLDDSCVIYGCTFEEACNFDPQATLDDGTCELESCAGCTDPLACNFDPEATFDNGSCNITDECGICGGDGIVDGLVTAMETW